MRANSPETTHATGGSEVVGSSDQSVDHFTQWVSAVEDYAIFTLDTRGFILNWNRGAERLKYYRAGEIVGSHFSTFYLPEDIAAALPDTELEIATDKGRFADEGWRLRKDGSRFWAGVTITAIRSEQGKLEGFLKITRDLTERMLATERLRQSEERFRLLLENVKDYAIFMLDPEGHVMTWNLGAKRIKGYEPSEIIGRHFSIFYPPEILAVYAPQELMREALRSGSAEHEGWRVRKDGTRFWGNVLITALYDDKGELRGFAKITRDLSSKKEVELLQQSAERKDVFLATLAHELRNPLAPILAAVDIIAHSPGNHEIVRQVGEMLQRQVGQMSRLIDDLLDISRINTGKILLQRSQVPLADVVRSAVEAVDPMVVKMGHTLTVDSPEGVLVDVDPHRISQVISNLLANSVKFTPSNGRIRLAIEVDIGNVLRIVVSDNGCGIPQALQGKIFGLFEQGISGTEGGMGIGLMLVKNIVEMHGGTVGVQSEGTGKGSQFTLLLPVVVAVADPISSEPAHPADPRSGKIRVLIADDGKSAADILTMFFQMEGMEAVTAYDGVEAVETAATFMPDLVCMDLGMPRMDGFEAARRIRSLKRDVFLVALSGWGAEEDRGRSAAAGFDLHLVKPVKPDDLRELISRHFKAE